MDDRWRLEGVVGRGGMASVYQARPLSEGEPVAIKVLHTSELGSADMVAQFEAEGRVMASLDHPNVVRVLGSGRMEDGAPYLVLELLRGVPLDRLIGNRGGALPPDEALVIVDQALDVLALCHSRDVVHRDLKPANLFVTSDGEVKVLDFGVARSADEVDLALARGTRLGTPSYMSPEQARNATAGVDGRSDIFAMGAVLYRLLSGRAIREVASGDEAFILAATTPPASVARAAPQLPLSVIRIVDRALAWSPDDRFQSAQAMSAAIRDVLQAGVALDAPVEVDARRAELKQALGRVVAQDDDALDLDARKEKLRVTKSVLRATAAVFGNVLQYDWDHDQAKARRKQLFDLVTDALAHFPAGVAWTIRPYGFDVGETPVWEPQHGTDDIPYNLFAGGFRTMRLCSGITQDELDRWLQLLMTDPVRDLAPDDDLGTVYLERDFPHVDADMVAGFDVGLLMDHVDVQEEFAEIRTAIHSELRADFDERASVAGLVAEVGAGGLKEADAIALSFDQGALQQLAAPRVTMVASDTLRERASVFLEEANHHDDRSWVALAAAVQDAAAAGDLALLEDPIVELVSEYVDSGAFGGLVSFFEGVYALLPTPEGRAFTTLVWGADAMRALSSAVVATAQSEAPVALRAGLAVVWDEADRRGYRWVVEAFGRTHGSASADALRPYVERHSVGGEATLGDALETAAEGLADELMDLLASSPRERAANRAFAQAAANPDARVRVLGLSYALSNPSESVLAEAADLLNHDDADARLATVELLAGLRVAAASPKVLAVAAADTFNDRPLRERHVILKFLFDNAPDEAEALAADIARRHGLFGDPRLDATRKLAVQLLGEYATSDDAVDAARAAGARVWWNPKELRDAAATALLAMRTRRGD